jgi:gentisate 1,2-dioxygenase
VWVDMAYPGSGAESNSKIQKTVHADGHSGRLYGHGGLMPTFINHRRGWGHNPNAMIHYRGADVREALEGLRKEQGDAYEGIQLEFVNPVNGAPVFSTLRYAAQLLRRGEVTQPKRETCNTFIVVMDGQGYTEVGGKRFDWEPNDIVVMPNFLWRRHVNTGNKDAVLYTVSDAALMKNIGQYRAQGRPADGEVVQLVP